MEKRTDGTPLDLEATRKQFGIERVDLKKFTSFDTSLALKISEEVCQYHRMVPVGVGEDGKVKLVMMDPFDMVAQEIVRSKTGFVVEALWGLKKTSSL